MSRLPQHVSSVVPIAGYFDGTGPSPLVSACSCVPGGHKLDCEEHGIDVVRVPRQDRAETLVLQVPPPPLRETFYARRRRLGRYQGPTPVASPPVRSRAPRSASPLVVHTATPSCWALALELTGGDTSLLTIEPDGSVIIHNNRSQRARWLSRERV